MSNSTSAEYAITQKIPVSDHVYKYLLSRCGTDEIVATSNNFIGSMILDHLTRTPEAPHSRNRMKLKNDFTKTFIVTIKEASYTRTGLYLSAHDAKKLHDKFDQMFREDLFNYLIMHYQQRESLFLQSMRQYLDFIGITEDDIKMETLYKDFKRRKKRYEQAQKSA